MARSDEEQEPSDSQKTAEKKIKEFASWPAMNSNTKFVIFYILSVSLDPLLLYSLILNDDRKCVVVDRKLEKIAIVLRSLADLSYIRRIICEIPQLRKLLGEVRSSHGEVFKDGTSYGYNPKKFVNVVVLMIVFWWGFSMTMGILAALPVPQIAILVFFPKLRASRAVNRMRIMNSLILLQYVPRIYPIYKYCKNLNSEALHTLKLLGLLNFILYIIASHVFGAFWYFFSIQRQIECWGYACQSGKGCEFRIFDCDDGTLRNVTLLNDLCPINPSNAKVFDFGIYLDALQSGMLGSTDFPLKFFQCFSWGVRNLSSFGSNLKTSLNAWETLFVVFISISGLLLFMYLLGNLQTYMQTHNKDKWISQKTHLETELMSKAYELSGASSDILKIVRRLFPRGVDLPQGSVFSILPPDVQNIIKRHLFLPKLKELVARLQGIDKKEVLDVILNRLDTVIYDRANYIIQEGEPLDMMIFISRGSVLTYNTTSTGHGGGGSGLSNTIGRLTRGNFYGQELMSWAAAATSTSFSDLPISNKTLKSHEKVEIFAIKASDLLFIFSKHKEKTEPQRPHPTDDTLIEMNEHGNS